MLDGRSTPVKAVAHVIVGPTAMYGAAIVPDDGIAHARTFTGVNSRLSENTIRAGIDWRFKWWAPVARGFQGNRLWMSLIDTKLTSRDVRH
jgi:hypothetical protein